MNVNHHQAKRDRSYFEWGDKMQIVRKGNGDIAMTETELVDFFGVTWRKLNNRLQEIIHNPNLYPDERSAGERVIVRDNELVGYVPLYPLPIIIALSFQLDSTEAYLFRKYICREIHRPANIITPIFLIGKTDS